LLFAGLCALNGAFVPAVAKLTTNEGSPLFVAAATSGFAALFGATLLILRGELGVVLNAATAPRLLVTGALGSGLSFLFFFLGAQRVSAIESVLCLQIEPLYSLLAAWVFLGHRPTPRRVAAIATLLSGIFLAVGGNGGVVPSLGVCLLLLTPLCWQMSHLVVLRGLRHVHPVPLTAGRYVVGSFVLALCWLVGAGPSSLPPWPTLSRTLPLLALQGVVLSYVGTLVWYQSVMRLDLTRATAIVVPSTPILSLAATFVLLGDLPTWPQWIGMILVAIGVAVFITAPAAGSGKSNAPRFESTAEHP